MSDAEKWLADSTLHSRLVATGEKIEKMRSLPDKWNSADKSWKAIDSIVSKIYSYLAEEFDDAPEDILYSKVLSLLNGDYNWDSGTYTKTGLVLLATRAQNTAQLIREYRALADDDKTKVIEEQYRLDFFKPFTQDRRRGAILKVLGEELRARGAARMVRE